MSSREGHGFGKIRPAWYAYDDARTILPGGFFQERIMLAVPDEPDQADIHRVYFNELVKGTVLPETRQRLLTIVDRLKEREASKDSF